MVVVGWLPIGIEGSTVRCTVATSRYYLQYRNQVGKTVLGSSPMTHDTGMRMSDPDIAWGRSAHTG